MSNLCRTLDHEEENVLVSNLVLTQLCSHETVPRESTYTCIHLCRLWWAQEAFIARYMNPLMHCSHTIKIRPVLLQLVDTDKNLIPGLYCASATISTISPPCSWSWQGIKVCKTSRCHGWKCKDLRGLNCKDFLGAAAAALPLLLRSALRPSRRPSGSRVES